MVSLSIFSYYLIHKNTPVLEIIPVIGALGLGAQRMLPLLQQFYTSWVSLKAGKDTIIQVNLLLKQDLPYYYNTKEISKLEILSEISLVNIDFKYQNDGNLILSNLNMVIPKGSRIGIIGKTGSGKSTLIDIIMGLLEPTHGKIIIDKTVIDKKNVRSWQRQIAHVPQFIYLSDSTITENIAFGLPKENIDLDKVILSAKKAQIYDYIINLKDNFQTTVGERGVRLSGGQRQRIGIARALYKEASVIIFDEATSALDIETEKAVMESIENLDKELTLIIITHRLTTIEKCSLVYEVENGKIAQKNLSTK
jgi:ATP-binding cassette subfamily B protein